MTDLPKTFDPAEIEARWYAHWEATGAFRPHRPDARPFTIVNPPPNVTGSLHIGHALDNTLQDVLVRYHRLRGRDAMWVVGMDHAGIATQMVVERQLAERQQKRTDFSREDFIAKVWEWKSESGGQITRQLRRLGCSMDWSREQFTMDPHFSKAVIKVFVDLYNQGLIYRDKRLVNWDPKLRTAISDLEVETREVQGHMWHFKYPLAGGETYRYVERDSDGAVLFEEQRDYIAIATTRPETMLGDGAVAVHPDDERYRPIVGKLCEIPVGPKAGRRLIPIITDEYPDPAFGSGAVKITGAHDQNDYAVAQRNRIPMYRLMDMDARMRDDGASYAHAAARAREIAAGASASAAEIDALNLVPEAYRGLDRYEARKRVVADIDADGLMIRVEDKTIMQPFGDRSGVVIEPMLTDQWYVDAATLARPAIDAVRSGAIEIVPKTWEKTFFNWMENIQPWCVSRQLWWGHRIPAWYGSDGKCYVAENAAAAQRLAGDDIALEQDPDVLDTWFSSALWPFATLGWPEDASSPSPLQGRGSGRGDSPDSTHAATTPHPTLSPEGERAEGSLLTRHYPNDVLISGFDILFFWDARMMMQGLHFMKEVPFRTLYLHGLVRAADGSKMSKSKGNTVDPLGLVDRYGADALRFFMTAMESQGRDIKMDERRVEGYRNFATKLWNAARFCQAKGIAASTSLAAPAATLAVNRWIIGETVRTVEEMEAAFAAFRFDDAANAIYHFAWDQFCGWYLEDIKPVLSEVEGPVPSNADSNPPLEGEVAAGTADGGVAATMAAPLQYSADGPPRLAGEDQIAETRAVAGWVLDQILVMLHPVMPFITEELWNKTGARDNDLILAKWPERNIEIDGQAVAEMNWSHHMISTLRKVRADLGIGYNNLLNIIVRSETEFSNRARLGQLSSINHKARIGSWLPGQSDSMLGGGLSVRVGGGEYWVSLEGIIDIDAERARLTKSIDAATKERDALAARLANPAFVERAKPEAVEKARADHAEKAAEAERLQAALDRLG